MTEQEQTVVDSIGNGNESLYVWWCEQTGEPLGEYASAERFEEQFNGIYDTVEDYAQQYLEDTGALDGWGDLRYYFDYEAYARDLQYGGDIMTVNTPGGVAVFLSY